MNEQDEKKKDAAKEVKAKKADGPKLAIVRVRGGIRLSKDIKDTLKMLNLKKKHNCVIVPKTPNYMGMLKKVKDYATWGDIEPDTKKFLEKRTKKGKTYLITLQEEDLREVE